eukprot:6202217-Pleurochrysis_carterae.AAC.5
MRRCLPSYPRNKTGTRSPGPSGACILRREFNSAETKSLSSAFTQQQSVGYNCRVLLASLCADVGESRLRAIYDVHDPRPFVVDNASHPCCASSPTIPLSPISTSYQRPPRQQ